jgi:hypothetical protein
VNIQEIAEWHHLDLGFGVACHYPGRIVYIDETLEMKNLEPTETGLLIGAEDLRVLAKVKKRREQVEMMGPTKDFEKT